MNKAKIVHLTSAHPRYDIRIFIKMCCSLAKADYGVSLVVADGKGYEVKNSVKIYDVGKPLRRIERMLKSSLLVYKRALKLNGDIYHIHDPELLPYAFLLKLKGKKVIFDSHEDTPRQILSKPYLLFRHCEALKEPWQSKNLHTSNEDVINKNFLKLISFIYEKIEKYICRRLDCVITATPFIRDVFFKYNIKAFDINNFPILTEIEHTGDITVRNIISYVGRITASRGCNELVEAMQYVKNDIKLCLAGLFDNSINQGELKQKAGFEKTEYKGFLNQDEMKKLLGSSFAGIVTIYPLLNYMDSLPTKMFEYMRAGIPVIASDFPLWKKIIEENNCGICVNPLKPIEIAKAIDYLFEHKEESRQMGLNGQLLVREKYNWEIEKDKLLKIYKELL